MFRKRRTNLPTVESLVRYLIGAGKKHSKHIRAVTIAAVRRSITSGSTLTVFT